MNTVAPLKHRRMCFPNTSIWKADEAHTARLANGSGPSPSSGEVLVQPERKRAQSRPSMKAVLSGEIDTDNELDVPAFIRRHGAHQ